MTTIYAYPTHPIQLHAGNSDYFNKKKKRRNIRREEIKVEEDGWMNYSELEGKRRERREVKKKREVEE